MDWRDRVVMESEKRILLPSLRIFDIEEIHTFRFRISENRNLEVSSSYLQKCRILCFFLEASSGMRVYLFLLVLYSPVEKGLTRTEIKSSSVSHM